MTGRDVRLALAAALIALACGDNAPSAESPDSVAPAASSPRADSASARVSTPDNQSDSALAGLDSTELALPGLSYGLDSAEVRRRLGAPDSVTLMDFPYETDSLGRPARIAHWHYSGRWLNFTLGGTLVGVGYTDSSFVTVRGLRVGDAATRLRELGYSTEDIEDGDLDLPSKQNEMLVMRVWVAGGRVTRIYLGWLDD